MRLRDNNDLTIELQAFQDRFIFDKAEFPAFVGGWGTGKTLTAIARALVYSEEIPNNLGIIFRKTFRDLQDSTMRDFCDYTGYTIDSHRNCTLSNGSTIMFRHLNDLKVHNLNLGWFFIEQAEELESDREFFALWGRLRRWKVKDGKYPDNFKPSGWFQFAKLPIHTGFVIANVNGDNWIKSLWKLGLGNDAKFSLTEAVTQDNAENLSDDFLKNVESLKTKKPDIYARYVINDWDAEVADKAFNRPEDCIAGELESPVAGRRYVMGADLAKMEDYTVLPVFDRERKQLVYWARFNKVPWPLTKARIKTVARVYNNADVVLDATGLGDPIADDLIREGVRVIPYKMTQPSKEALVEKLIIAIENKLISYPSIDILIEELKDFRMKMNSSTKKFSYSAPSGKHDDCVIAVALAVWDLDIHHVVQETKPISDFWKRIKSDMQNIRHDRAGVEGYIDVEGAYIDAGF